MNRPIVIGLGSSMGLRMRSLRLATGLLAVWPGMRMQKKSRVYRSVALGPACQDFFNAAIRLETDRSADEVLAICKEIEIRLGRQATNRWMDRVIDLDLLLYGDERIVSPELVVPHPGLLVRPFAWVPAVEVGGDHVHPVNGLALRECFAGGPHGLSLVGCL